MPTFTLTRNNMYFEVEYSDDVAKPSLTLKFPNLKSSYGMTMEEKIDREITNSIEYFKIKPLAIDNKQEQYIVAASSSRTAIIRAMATLKKEVDLYKLHPEKADWEMFLKSFAALYRQKLTRAELPKKHIQYKQLRIKKSSDNIVGSHSTTICEKITQKQNQSQSSYFLKETENRLGKIAEIESAIAAHFRAFLGNDRAPKAKTVYEDKTRKGVNSKKIAGFKAFGDFLDDEYFKKHKKMDEKEFYKFLLEFDYGQLTQQGIVEMLVASYFLEENDLHANNWGFDANGNIVRIDFDQALWPFTAKFCMSSKELLKRHLPLPHKTFPITENDIREFPRLSNAKPYNWILEYNDKDVTEKIKTKLIADIQKHPQFYRYKWRAFLKIILTPTDLIKNMNVAYIGSKATKYTDHLIARREELRKVLMGMPEFVSFIKEQGRSELEHVIEQIEKDYNKKVKDLSLQYQIPTVREMYAELEKDLYVPEIKKLTAKIQKLKEEAKKLPAKTQILIEQISKEIESHSKDLNNLDKYQRLVDNLYIPMSALDELPLDTLLGQRGHFNAIDAIIDEYVFTQQSEELAQLISLLTTKKFTAIQPLVSNIVKQSSALVAKAKELGPQIDFLKQLVELTENIEPYLPFFYIKNQNRFDNLHESAKTHDALSESIVTLEAEYLSKMQEQLKMKYEKQEDNLIKNAILAITERYTKQDYLLLLTLFEKLNKYLSDKTTNNLNDLQNIDVVAWLAQPLQDYIFTQCKEIIEQALRNDNAAVFKEMPVFFRTFIERNPDLFAHNPELDVKYQKIALLACKKLQLQESLNRYQNDQSQFWICVNSDPALIQIHGVKPNLQANQQKQLENLQKSINAASNLEQAKKIEKQLENEIKSIKSSTEVVNSCIVLNKRIQSKDLNRVNEYLRPATEKVYTQGEGLFAESDRLLANHFMKPHKDLDVTLLSRTLVNAERAIDNPLSADLGELKENAQNLIGKSNRGKKIEGIVTVLIGSLAILAATVLLVGSIACHIPSFGISLLGLPLSCYLYGAGSALVLQGASTLFHNREQSACKASNDLASSLVNLKQLRQ